MRQFDLPCSSASPSFLERHATQFLNVDTKGSEGPFDLRFASTLWMWPERAEREVLGEVTDVSCVLRDKFDCTDFPFVV